MCSVCKISPEEAHLLKVLRLLSSYDDALLIALLCCLLCSYDPMMFLSPPLQLLSFYGLAVVLFAKIKNEVLYNVAHQLVSLHVLANAVTFYVLGSLVTGNWTASSNGVSPLRWLACLALPVFLASRGLRNKIVTSSGAIAILQVGFVLTLANLR